MRFWDDKDANGNLLSAAGPNSPRQVCLVIRADDEPNMPEMRFYGKDREEALEKAAKSAETAQVTIHRMRKTPATPAPPPPVRPGAIDLTTAVADLANPNTAVRGFKTIAKVAGIDVDQQARAAVANRIIVIADAWEKRNPDFPSDDRNRRMLIDRAIILAGGRPQDLTVESLDAAYEELTRQEVFHQDISRQTSSVSTVQPRGNEDSRTVRNATSYRRNSLRSAEPAPAAARESAKEAKWRDILEKGTSKALEEAIKNEPGFAEWVEKVMTKKTA